MIEFATVPASSFAAAGADRLADSIRSAQNQRGVCHLAVSGGTTPWPVFRELAQRPLDWAAVHIWQVDERAAPDGSDRRNATSLDDAFLSMVDLPDRNVHLMDVTAVSLSSAADAYAAALQAGCGGVLDMVHLGLGGDGHTASWPPGDPVVDIVDRDVALSGPYQGEMRMTLTVPCVNRARQRLFLVSGTDKTAVLDALRHGDDIPAAGVATDDTAVIFCRGIS